VLCRPGDDLLSQVLRHSTIGAEEFNGRVRDGIGFRFLARATRPAKHNRARRSRRNRRAIRRIVTSGDCRACFRSRSLDGIANRGPFASLDGRAIGLLQTVDRFAVRFRTMALPLSCEYRQMRAIKPIKRLVPVSCTARAASTPGLSTWWSTTAFKGEFILRWVSRLDAFSGYPDRT
jgi:hypothetical protein